MKANMYWIIYFIAVIFVLTAWLGGGISIHPPYIYLTMLGYALLLLGAGMFGFLIGAGVRIE